MPLASRLLAQSLSLLVLIADCCSGEIGPGALIKGLGPLAQGTLGCELAMYRRLSRTRPQLPHRVATVTK